MSNAILELESRVGVPKNFFRSLNASDDWSFIIKLHALFEAACTHLLLFHFKEPELTEVFSRLELSNKVTGKIAFLGKIGLLGKENRRFISTLSELRNSLVHDVRNAEFSLPAMVTGLGAAEVTNLAIAFSPFETHVRQFPYDPDMKLGYEIDWQTQAAVASVIERFKADPKYHIWIGAYSVLGSIVDMYGYSDYKQWVKAKEHFEDDEAP
ncbi:hypothetical protein [Ferrovum sp.]|uniref:hypothetical protein n=1 Tax=Ferrovum sp. TaxID=2609467 RepID=UPI002616FFCC|nr:hypothetical protein [Ferrovum sp.]